MTILDEIKALKIKRIDEEMRYITVEALKQRILNFSPPPAQDFIHLLKKKGKPAIIAEIKKASPSKGILREEFNPVEIAKEYYKSGVQAVSVITEKDFFLGCDEDFIRVRQAIPLPLLRKDFIVDCRQIYQSRLLGADAVLLIVSMLDDDDLKKMQAIANILGMACLIEVHDEVEVERAINAGAQIIGINNRDLKNFKVDLKTTERLIKIIPNDRFVISESGICNANDIKYLTDIGVDAVLVGETFMKAENIKNRIYEFIQARSASYVCKG